MQKQAPIGTPEPELSPDLVFAVSALERAADALVSAMDAGEAADLLLPNSTDEDLSRAVLWGQRAALCRESDAVHRALVRLGARVGSSC
jgi:hypothetical protein